MARFLDFPDELILGVISFIPPEDLENFAQTCSRVHSVAGPALEKHRLRIRQYSTLKNKGFRTIAKTLKEVLVNPEIGRYIWNVSLDYIGGSQRNLNPKYSAEDLELFVGASTSSELLQPGDWVPLAHCKDFIERGNEDTLLAILLPLLPNLRSLEFPRVSHNGDGSWTSCMFDHLPYVSTPTLTKLSTISVNTSGIYFHLDETKAYVNLPSVKSLSAFKLCCDSHNYVSLLWTPNSNITKLELWECKVPAKPLHDFLFGFHSLQSFAYSCDLPEKPAGTFDAFLIRSALLASARKTLQKLTILARHGRSPVMGTLRSFEVLDEVCIDLGLLLTSSWKPRPHLPIAKVLPNSLRRLDLNSAWDYSELVDSVVRAQKRGTHVHPQPYGDLAQFEWGLQLQDLTIASGMNDVATEEWMHDPEDIKDWDDLYRECEEVGISFHHHVRMEKKSTNGVMVPWPSIGPIT